MQARPGGLAGDRERSAKRQVTIVGRERWEAACAALGEAVDPVARRANLIVEGVDLPAAIGGVLRVGPVTVRVHGVTEPCERMDEMRPGLREVLQPDGRAGVYGEIVAGGEIAVGDRVERAATS